MAAIWKREMGGFFHSMLGYALVAFLVLMGGLYFFVVNLSQGYPEFGYTLYQTTFVFLVLVPILTMRSFAEERHTHTDQLLLTSPVSLPGVVLGKFLALFCVFCIPVAVLALCPLIMSLFGTVSMKLAYSAVLGYLLLGAAAIAIGVFISSLTENQIVAVVATFGVMLLAYLMEGIKSLFNAGSLMALLVFGMVLAVAAVLAGLHTRSVPVGIGVFLAGMLVLMLLFFLRGTALTGAFTALLGALALFTPFEQFVNGVFSITAIVYYLSVTALFLFLTGQALEKRRWN